MTRKQLLIALALVAVSGCSEPAIICDADGLIVIPKDAAVERQAELNNRNMDLSLRRLDQANGMASPGYRPLAKAHGCP